MIVTKTNRQVRVYYALKGADAAQDLPLGQSRRMLRPEAVEVAERRAIGLGAPAPKLEILVHGRAVHSQTDEPYGKPVRTRVPLSQAPEWLEELVRLAIADNDAEQP